MIAFDQKGFIYESETTYLQEKLIKKLCLNNNPDPDQKLNVMSELDLGNIYF